MNYTSMKNPIQLTNTIQFVRFQLDPSSLRRGLLLSGMMLGVLSLALSRPFSGSWADLVSLGQTHIENVDLEQRAEHVCRTMVDRLRPALHDARQRFLSEDYLVYVVSESADKIALIRFGPKGARLDHDLQTGDMPVDIDGPHGIALRHASRAAVTFASPANLALARRRP